MANLNLDKPPDRESLDWRTLRTWLFKLWTVVRNFDLSAAAPGNTQIDGNLTVTGNLTGMPLSLLAAAAGEQDGSSSSNGTQGGQYLGPVIAMSAVNTSSQTIASTTLVNITGWTTVTDTAHSFVASTGVYTVPVGGLYLVMGNVLMNTITYPADGYVQMTVNANATQIFNNLNMPCGVAFTSSVYLQGNVYIIRTFAAGDTITLQLAQSSSGPANTMYPDPTQVFNHFEVLKVG